MWLKVGYKYRLSTSPPTSTTFMTARCILLLLSLQLSGRADCFDVSFQCCKRTNERTRAVYLTRFRESVGIRERKREQSAGATWGKRLDRLSPSGFLQSTLYKCVLSPDQHAAAAFTVSPVCCTSLQPCFCFFLFFFNDESSLIIIGQQWLIMLVAVMVCLNRTAHRMFVGENQAACCISQMLHSWSHLLCVCVRCARACRCHLTACADTVLSWNQPQVLAICAPNLCAEGERGAHACGCSVTSCKLLSSDNLWTRWGGVQWKNIPHPHWSFCVLFFFFFFPAQHLFPLRFSRRCSWGQGRRTLCANVYQCSLIRSEAPHRGVFVLLIWSRSFVRLQWLLM